MCTSVVSDSLAVVLDGVIDTPPFLQNLFIASADVKTGRASFLF